MQTLSIGDYTFHYTEKGGGPPVLFLHGSLSDYRTWEHQLPVFAEHFRALAYSRRYHYPNAQVTSSADYTFTRHARDLSDFMTELDLRDVHLVGSSYGAYVGLLAALEKPDRFRTLVLCEPPVIPLLVSDPENPLQALWLLLRDFSTGRSFLKFGIKAMDPAKKQLEMGNLEEGVRLFTNGVLGKGGFEHLPAKARAATLDNAPALKAELLGPGFPSGFPQEKARRLDLPVLLVEAAESPAFFHAISDKLSNLLPAGRKVVIEEASHDMQNENPEAFNEKILAFLFEHD